MSPVPLPPAMPDYIVSMPPGPSEPPSCSDVLQAAQYVERLSNANGFSNVAPGDHAAAHVYLHNIVHAKAMADDRGWFKTSLREELRHSLAEMMHPRGSNGSAHPKEAIASMRTAVIEQRLDAFDHRLSAVEKQLSEIGRISAISHNRSSTPDALVIVPFVDGSSPLEKPHQLPALTSRAIAKALSLEQSHQYFRGYFPDEPIPGDLQSVQQRTLAAVGCPSSD
ncbi:hypothetical protein HGRIS_004552 [Hohenbuehelia grisea]|uniref:Mug135-like C-terminal domain-containing protein n=1 Tax=Hohenbuehelia grisea TaxID=104357 RepID=A0ABR3JD16_9AGAR